MALLGCCLVSLHFLFGILTNHPVQKKICYFKTAILLKQCSVERRCFVRENRLIGGGEADRKDYESLLNTDHRPSNNLIQNTFSVGWVSYVVRFHPSECCHLHGEHSILQFLKMNTIQLQFTMLKLILRFNSGFTVIQLPRRAVAAMLPLKNNHKEPTPMTKLKGDAPSPDSLE